MVTIDLKDYRQSGEGANGASYDSLTDPSIMVKLYNADYPVHTISSELEVARKVYDLGIPSPEPGELVTDGSRIGIRFRRIVGKRSYSRMLADEPERIDEYTREFARCCKRLHSVVCPQGVFPDAKEQFLDLLSKVNQSESIKRNMAEFIKSVPDSVLALHGDMHIGNAISTLPKGQPLDSPHDVFFIDLGYFSCGCPLFDLGMMMNICLSADEEFRQHDFHLKGEFTREVWKIFAEEYFFGPEKLGEKWFGKGQTVESVTRLLNPYQCCKLLLVQYNLGFMPPHYQEVMDKSFL